MNSDIKSLKGSKKRDTFKWAHKNMIGPLGASFYAADADLCLICPNPRGVVAYLDYKGSGEGITFTEKILYDEWATTKPVYIIAGEDPENGPFDIYRYLLGGSADFICTIKTWIEWCEWERTLRASYVKDISAGKE